MKQRQEGAIGDIFSESLELVFENFARLTGYASASQSYPVTSDALYSGDSELTADRIIPGQSRIAVAYSGGLDSSVLLHLASQYATARGIQLFAFHIHHGISENADMWLRSCQEECKKINVVFGFQQINVENSKSGIEEAARIKRYAALGDLCRSNNVQLLLTAHHLDDQAETVLLQLSRGSGLAGLSGMDSANTSAELLGDEDIVMARPLLAVSRIQLENFARCMNLSFVEDESNFDQRYTRNVLRHSVMPSLEKHFPGFQERFARTAMHAQAAQRLLIELAEQDLAFCQDGDAVDINLIRKFSSDRTHNMLRYWFGKRGLRMPSTAWLAEMCKQILGARTDAQLCVTHPECHIRRHRDRIFITPKFVKLDEEDICELAQDFQWNGESEIFFPSYDGTLHFDHAQHGVNAEWLRSQTLKIHYRKGGERLKLAANRPTKNLKYHYQSCNIPAWERERLPIVSVKDRLLMAAGIGMDCHHYSNDPCTHIYMRWVPK